MHEPLKITLPYDLCGNGAVMLPIWYKAVKEVKVKADKI